MAKHCFDKSQQEIAAADYKVLLLSEAQFYVAELDRRSSGRIALRDLILEIVVILMIGMEIGLAIKQGADEDSSMNKQDTILTSLQQGTSATASTLQGLLTLTGTMNESTATTAKTLNSLENTTRVMNQGVHDQIALFYDPSVVITYDATQKKIVLSNTGRSAITITEFKLNGSALSFVGGGDAARTIPEGSGYQIDNGSQYSTWESQIPKGGGMVVPVIATLKNELGRTYHLQAALYVFWQNDKLTVYTQTYSITPDLSPTTKSIVNAEQKHRLGTGLKLKR